MRLIDADELKKDLQDWISENWTDAFIGDDAGVEFIDIIDSVQTVPQWISVEDRLPEKNKPVLVLVAEYTWVVIDRSAYQKPIKYIDIDRLTDGGFWKAHHIGVMYWMPLPEPPKEEKCG